MRLLFLSIRFHLKFSFLIPLFILSGLLPSKIIKGQNAHSNLRLPLHLKPENQKAILIMLDGFGMDYYRNSDMPTLNEMEKKGLFKVVSSLMPSVTNVNNASICTGELPDKHGITGNSFFNPTDSSEEFMKDSSLVMAPTIFERAKTHEVHSILFSSKKKTIGLLSRGTDESLSPETASKTWIERIGPVPDIYSREVNYWLMEAALYSMQHDSTIGLYYIHTTDYPMHTWSPESRESKNIFTGLTNTLPAS